MKGSQLLARNVSLVRAMVMPVAMTGLSVYGIASAFGAAGQALLPVGAWLAAAVLIASVALWLQPAAPQGTLPKASRAASTFQAAPCRWP